MPCPLTTPYTTRRVRSLSHMRAELVGAARAHLGGGTRCAPAPSPSRVARDWRCLLTATQRLSVDPLTGSNPEEAAMFGKRTVLVALMATTLVLGAVAVASATDPLRVDQRADRARTGQPLLRGQPTQGQRRRRQPDHGATRRVLGLALAPRHHRRRLAVRSAHAVQRADRRRQVPGPHLHRRAGVPRAPQERVQAVNTGSEPYVLAVTFFNVPPNNGPSRIDQADPGNC